MTAYIIAETRPPSRLRSRDPADVTCAWSPGQQDCFRASEPAYRQRPALRQRQPAS